MPSLKLPLSACVLLVFALPVAAQSDFAHPLDPLNKDEIAAVVATLRAENKATASSRFYTLILREPPKAEVLSFKPGATFRREAFVVVFERAANKTFEAVVDIRAQKVVSWKEIKNAQPSMMLEDFGLAQSIANGDLRWRAALQKRGISDYENVQIDAWSAGWFGFPDEANIRMARGIPFYRGTSKNAYAHPIEGLVAYIDLTH